MAHWNVYVGCFTADLWKYFPRPESDATVPSEGIERLLFDDSNGTLETADVIGGDLSNPQYVRRHPALPVLYAAEFARPGRLVSFQIDPRGHLTRQSAVRSLAGMALSLAVHPAGETAYVGHLDDSVITAFRLDKDGRLIDAERATSPESAAPPPPREAALFAYKGFGSKHHQVRVSPDGNALLVTDVGRDRVTTYRLDRGRRLSREPDSSVAFPDGSAPRHLEFHPSGKFIFVVGEHDANLHVLGADAYVPNEILATYQLAPPGYSRKVLPSELVLHPDGRTLFVGIRRADRIAAFDVDASGTATELYYQPSLGRNTRALAIDPSGRHLLVANWESNSVVSFAINDDRTLDPTNSVEVRSPSSIVFGMPVPGEQQI